MRKHGKWYFAACVLFAAGYVSETPLIALTIYLFALVVVAVGAYWHLQAAKATLAEKEAAHDSKYKDDIATKNRLKQINSGFGE